MKAYYYGLVPGGGHALCCIFDGHLIRMPRDQVTPWPDIDNALQPGCQWTESRGLGYWHSPPVNVQTQSAGRLHHKDGWTAIAFWDRTGDGRYGSNSTFIFEATLTFAEAVDRARETFPEVVARMEAAAPLHEADYP